jgi:hypothetical protein
VPGQNDGYRSWRAILQGMSFLPSPGTHHSGLTPVTRPSNAQLGPHPLHRPRQEATKTRIVKISHDAALASAGMSECERAVALRCRPSVQSGAAGILWAPWKGTSSAWCRHSLADHLLRALMLERVAVADQAARSCICRIVLFSSSDNAGGTRPGSRTPGSGSTTSARPDRLG